MTRFRTIRFRLRRPARGGVLAALLLAAAIFPPAQAQAPAAEENAMEEPGSAPGEQPYTMRVAVLVYEGVELLDFAGPAEVFSVAAGFGAAGDVPAFEVYTVARSREPVATGNSVTVQPRYGVADAPLPDLLVLPGGNSARARDDAAVMDWIRRATPGADLTLTVCTGASILGATGRLDGRDVTTWYGAVDRLQQAHPKARVHHGRRFVDSGDVVTTAGVSAGIDGSLHVVARLLGRRVAEETARYMEYHWSPEPYLARTYREDNPRLETAPGAAAAAAGSAAAGD